MERIDRAIYWLLLALASAVFVAAWSFFSSPPQLGVAVILTAIPRLHDIGRSGWWSIGLFIASVHVQTLFSTGPEVFVGSRLIAIILAVPLAGALVALGMIPGQPGANAFGAPRRSNR